LVAFALLVAVMRDAVPRLDRAPAEVDLADVDLSTHRRLFARCQICFQASMICWSST
jgi:hypothetical protein